MTNEQNERREAVLAVAQSAVDLSESLLDGPTTASSAAVGKVATGVTQLAILCVGLCEENARLQAEVKRLSVPWWRRLGCALIGKLKPYRP